MYNIWLATHYLTIAYTKVLKTKMKKCTSCGRQTGNRMLYPTKKKNGKIIYKNYLKKEKGIHPDGLGREVWGDGLGCRSPSSESRVWAREVILIWSDEQRSDWLGRSAAAGLGRSARLELLQMSKDIMKWL